MILSIEQILQLHPSIDTPALIVDYQQLERNIENMQDLANINSVRLRPHIKTHKSVLISDLLLKQGAVGITVAKVAEAEIMAAAGISDIFIANQITHPLKLERLKKLHEKITISVGIDHIDQIDLLKRHFIDTVKPLKVLIEIDCGLHRCGMIIGKKLVHLAKKITQTNELCLEGIFTHAGQVYGAQSPEEILKIGNLEGSTMAEVVTLLENHSINLNVVSVGSTPTVVHSSKNPIVTEIRPGNFVFYDNIQYVLGSCSEKDWALAILATVVSKPAEDQIVIDAGSKALNLDRGAHATQLIKGFGRVLNIDGEIIRLSEEHGIIKLTSNQSIPLGSPVIIIPNHACAVVNLFSHYYFVDSTGRINKIPIDARGMSQ
jgi:D-serine deaminase-like pyridoxal phosphate-dependent protein